jgi:ADP-L-glycero-D-manno-heptose 6-epimerase
MIIVTGGAGFIGSNIVRHLNRRGIEDIVIMDDLTDGSKIKNLADLKFVDYREWDQKFFWDEDPKEIYHCGGISSTLENDGRKLMVKNYQYSVSLFETALAYDVPVKYCSSASIYGKTVDPSKETDPLTALNPYAFSKLMVERWLEQNENTVTAFRLFNVYGDHEDHKIYRKQASPISKFIHEVQHTGSVTLFNGSKGIFRDFICVDDVATVMINFPSKKFGSYNLGTGQTWSFFDIANAVIKKYGGVINWAPFPTNLLGRYQAYTCADMTKTQEEFSTELIFTTPLEYIESLPN